MTKRDTAPAKPVTETTTVNTDDVGNLNDVINPGAEANVPEPVTGEEKAAIIACRTNPPVGYVTDEVAKGLITKGLAVIASVDPAPEGGHKAISLTLAGKSWADRNRE